MAIYYNREFFRNQDIEEQKEYLDGLTEMERVLISRYTYLKGIDTLLLDSVYDEITHTPEYEHLKEIPYEEDDASIIKDHLIALGIYIEPNTGNDLQGKADLINMFSQNKSMMCVTSVKEYKDKYLDTYLNDATDYFLLSYKHDGWNITAYYLPDKGDQPYYAHTRGRDSAEVRDCTELMRCLLPRMKVEYPTKVVMEVVVKKDKLEYLRTTYPDKKWVNARNSVASFISGSVREEDYDTLDYFAFVYEDLGSTNMDPNDTYIHLRNNGFKTPIYRKIKPVMKDIVEGLNDFEKLYVEEIDKVYECDGLVMVASISGVHKEVFTAYSTGMVAIKAGYWSSEVIKAKIETIYYSQSKKSFSPMARIFPVKSRSGSMITNVPLVNLGLVARDWLHPGDEILIQYHSQQNVYYLSKESGVQRPMREDIG